jgi:hypothetical protein
MLDCPKNGTEDGMKKSFWQPAKDNVTQWIEDDSFHFITRFSLSRRSLLLRLQSQDSPSGEKRRRTKSSKRSRE